MDQKDVEFVRRKAYVLEQNLTRGACGETVVLYDSIIEERFVCKKYNPIAAEYKEHLFRNFVDEIKILYLTNHPNIVRVFSYYLYPDLFLGYIIMEYVKGNDIDEYIRSHPEDINEVFRQTIEGFSYLEQHQILHRDIRLQNILVGEHCSVKIIDFGFGKRISTEVGYDKSISLNWWCPLPTEFEQDVYDFSTEVYFVGRLFEKMIVDHDIRDFKFTALLTRMCMRDPAGRFAAFSVIRRSLLSDEFMDIDFDDQEREVYKLFSNRLVSCVNSIEFKSKYYDVEIAQGRLEECYKKIMLEDAVPKGSQVLSCFINGSYRFHSPQNFYTSYVKDFLGLLRSASKEKKNIILSNIQSKLDSVKRHGRDLDDDIPF